MYKEKCHKGKNPKECTPEQIKECHGDVKEHPCGEEHAHSHGEGEHSHHREHSHKSEEHVHPHGKCK